MLFDYRFSSFQRYPMYFGVFDKFFQLGKPLILRLTQPAIYAMCYSCLELITRTGDNRDALRTTFYEFNV